MKVCNIDTESWRSLQKTELRKQLVSHCLKQGEFVMLDAAEDNKVARWKASHQNKEGTSTELCIWLHVLQLQQIVSTALKEDAPQQIL